MSHRPSRPNNPASSPCMAGDLEQRADGGFQARDPQQDLDVARWRKAERQRLLAIRQAIPAVERAGMDEAIRAALAVHLQGCASVGFYWPFRAEPDLRPLIELLTAAGIPCALPVVEGRDQPLSYRAYRPGDALAKGAWDIPVPARAEAASPQTLICPVVGFDAAGYRLGYGGGFFDRTLAARTPPPRLIGVGYEVARIATVFPQAHDMPMNLVVTEAGCFEPTP